MISRNYHNYLKTTLLLNGIIDTIGAFFMIFFPGLIPGYAEMHYHTSFAAGGWGVAALTFGIGRIWASRKPEYHGFMLFLGFFEGVILSIYCVIRILFSPTSLVQALFPLAIGSVFAIAYGVGYLIRWLSQSE